MTEKVRDFAKKVVELGKNKVQDAQQSFDNAVSYPARHLPQQTPEQKDANIMRLKKAQVDTELWALPKEREAEQYVPGLATARGYMGGGPGIGDQTVAKAVENAKRQPREAVSVRPVAPSLTVDKTKPKYLPIVEPDGNGGFEQTGWKSVGAESGTAPRKDPLAVTQKQPEGLSGMRTYKNPPTLSNEGRNVNVQYHKQEKGPIPGYRVPDDASRFEEGMQGLLTNSIHQETQTPEDNVAYRQHYNEEAHQEEALRKEAARKANPGKMKLKEAQTEDVYRK